MHHDDVLATLREHLVPLSGLDTVEPVLDAIGDARVVLLGEASHGTHEFYAMRALVTQRLIERGQVRAVAVEADWPDARRVDRFVRGIGDDVDADAGAAMQGFRRFPQWMWRNTVVRSFVAWLRDWNSARPGAGRCAFHGIDLYSLHSSIDAVLRYLERVDPRAAERARGRYACFEMAGTSDPQQYGFAVSRNRVDPCEDEVTRQLAELRHCADEYRGVGGEVSADDFFSAEQNARLVANAERYYRAMFRGRASSWNLRDTHMAETLDAIIDRMEQHHGRAGVAVWAHNSHLGDARATAMGKGGELNVGQLVRQRHGGAACLVGLSTYGGSVTAAHDWGEPAQRRRVRPALAGSVEALMHRVGTPGFLLDLRAPPVAAALADPRIERAIGVIYRPETERMSHYFEVDLPRQFDLLIHLDETRALEPLERTVMWEAGEPPETYPSGL